MKRYKFDFWYRWGDNEKDMEDVTICGVEDEDEAKAEFEKWLDKEAGRSVRVGLIRKSIVITQL